MVRTVRFAIVPSKRHRRRRTRAAASDPPSTSLLPTKEAEERRGEMEATRRGSHPTRTWKGRKWCRTSWWWIGLLVVGWPMGEAQRQLQPTQTRTCLAEQPLTCGGRGEYDETTCRCNCPTGWKGVDCALCDRDESCTANQEGLPGTCDTSLQYRQDRAVKNYTCTMDDANMNELLADDVRMSCDRGEKECYVEIAFAMEAERNIVCKAFECRFTEGSMDVKCDRTKCDCPNGCPDGFETIVNGIEDEAELTCASENSCTINLADLPLTFVGTCVVGTCQYGDRDGLFLDDFETTDTSSDAAVVGVICGVIGGMILLLGVYFLLSYRKEKGVRAEIHRLEDALGMDRDTYLPDSSASLFEFSGVTCTIVKSTGNNLSSSVMQLFASPRDRLKTPRRPKDDSPRDENEDAALDVVHGTYDELGQRVILKEASGSVASGSMIAFMGPSGSGKTTLLSVLVGAHVGKQVRVDGKVTLDGEDVSKSGGSKFSRFRRITGFVHQEDMLLPTLTVYESILYSAMLRLPFYWTKAKKYNWASNVIQELSLETVKNARIGGSLGSRGISGGERRRVSIGMELTTNPRILALDEPTSGLDSFSAYTVMQALRNLTKQGNKMVILSLHQPSSEVFQELDQVHFLAKGSTVYAGPAKQVCSFVEQSGLPCPVGHNIADWMLSLVSHRDSLNTLLKSWSVNKALYASSANGPETIEEEDAMLVSANNHPSAQSLATESSESSGDMLSYARTHSTRDYLASLSPTSRKKLTHGVLLQPPLRELRVLLWRSYLVLLRNPALMLTHFVVSLLLAVLCGLTFQGLEPNLQGFQNRSGFLFFSLSFFAFASLTSIDVFMAERDIFFRERMSKYYRTSTYYFTKVVLDALLLRIVPVCFFGLVTYWWIGLQESSSKIGIFFASMMLFNVTVEGLSMCISIASPTAGVATLASTVLLLLMVLFGGLYVNVETVTDALSWLKYVSLFHYAYEALLSNEMEGLLVTFNVPDFPPVPNVRGEVYLGTLNMSHGRIGTNLAALGGFCVGFYLLGYLLLVPGRKFAELFSSLCSACTVGKGRPRPSTDDSPSAPSFRIS